MSDGSVSVETADYETAARVYLRDVPPESEAEAWIVAAVREGKQNQNPYSLAARLLDSARSDWKAQPMSTDRHAHAGEEAWIVRWSSEADCWDIESPQEC